MSALCRVFSRSVQSNCVQRVNTRRMLHVVENVYKKTVEIHESASWPDVCRKHFIPIDKIEYWTVHATHLRVHLNSANKPGCRDLFVDAFAGPCANRPQVLMQAARELSKIYKPKQVL
jgi:hypothetical protein